MHLSLTIRTRRSLSPGVYVRNKTANKLNVTSRAEIAT